MKNDLLSKIHVLLSQYAGFVQLAYDQHLPQDCLKRSGITRVIQWLANDAKCTARIMYLEHPTQGVAIAIEFPITGQLKIKYFGSSKKRSPSKPAVCLDLTSDGRIALYYRSYFSNPVNGRLLLCTLETCLNQGGELAKRYHNHFREVLGYPTTTTNDKLYQFLMGRPVVLSDLEMAQAYGGFSFSDTLMGLGLTVLVGSHVAPTSLLAKVPTGKFLGGVLGCDSLIHNTNLKVRTVPNNEETRLALELFNLAKEEPAEAVKKILDLFESNALQADPNIRKSTLLKTLSYLFVASDEASKTTVRKASGLDESPVAQFHIRLIKEAHQRLRKEIEKIEKMLESEPIDLPSFEKKLNHIEPLANIANPNKQSGECESSGIYGLFNVAYSNSRYAPKDLLALLKQNVPKSTHGRLVQLFGTIAIP